MLNYDIKLGFPSLMKQGLRMEVNYLLFVMHLVVRSGSLLGLVAGPGGASGLENV
jgi:hypothetical protein